LKGSWSELKIVNNSIKKIEIRSKPKGKYFKKPSLIKDSFISNIITTKRKRTATAPTYTINKVIAKNSALRIKKIIAELKKVKIKNKTE
jgi:uncharacterized protein YehS (DUF1456 family)